MEAVGVESGGKELIFNNIKHLRKYFSHCFLFLRILRVHFCPLALRMKTHLAKSRGQTRSLAKNGIQIGVALTVAIP
jgi:hypothetical protein